MKDIESSQKVGPIQESGRMSLFKEGELMDIQHRYPVRRRQAVRNEGRRAVPQIEAAELVPPAHVDRVYHYTPAVNWKGVKREGALQPTTSGKGWSMILSDTLRAITEGNPDVGAFWQRKHIVGGVDDKGFDAWKATGDHDRLLEYVAKGEEELVLLSFPASVVKGAYIMDHSHISRSRREELFGEEPLFNGDGQRISREGQERVFELEGGYYKSVVRGFEYDGSYTVPEIWIPHPVSVRDITVEAVGSVDDFR